MQPIASVHDGLFKQIAILLELKNAMLAILPPEYAHFKLGFDGTTLACLVQHPLLAQRLQPYLPKLQALVQAYHQQGKLAGEAFQIRVSPV